MSKLYYQPDRVKQMITNPHNKIYYNPQITDESIVDFVKANDNNAEKLNQIPNLYTQWRYLTIEINRHYSHSIKGKLYVGDELELNRFTPHIYRHDPKPIMKADNHGGVYLDIQNINNISNNSHGNYEPSQYPSIYSKISQHQYHQQVDHLINYEYYYNDEHEAGTLIIQALSTQSVNSKYVPDSRIINVNLSAKEIETFTHPLINQLNNLIDQYFALNIHGLQDLLNEGHIFDSSNIENVTQFSNAYNGFNPRYLNLWLHENIDHQMVITKDTWLEDAIIDKFYDLPTTQQQALLRQLYVTFLNNDVFNNKASAVSNKHLSRIDTDDKTINFDTINDHLTNYHYHRLMPKDDKLPILNQNQFIQQLTTLADPHLYYNGDAKTTYVKPQQVDSFKLPLSNNVVKTSLTENLSNNIQEDNDVIIDGQPHYYPKGTLHHLRQNHINMFIFSPISNNQRSQKAFETLMTATKLPMVLTYFTFDSNHSYYIGTEMTLQNEHNLMVIPIRCLYDNHANDLTIPNNQSNLTTLSTFDWHYNTDLTTKRINLGIITDSFNYQTDEFIMCQFSPIANVANHQTRLIAERKYALVHDKNFQNYITKL